MTSSTSLSDPVIVTVFGWTAGRMPTSSICHSWSASAETGRAAFSHCWVSSRGETGCRRQRPALARRSTAAACHRSGGMVAGLGARREPAERRQRGPTKLADPGYASRTAGEADCVAAEDGWGGVMQIIVAGGVCRARVCTWPMSRSDGSRSCCCPPSGSSCSSPGSRRECRAGAFGRRQPRGHFPIGGGVPLR